MSHRLSKHNDINAVLGKAEKILKEIEGAYNGCLSKQTIDMDMLVEIKDFFTNLRSALDYLSNRVLNINFPICDTELQFGKNLHEVQDALKISFLKWQPFKGNPWLKNFRILTNKNKHVTLIPQTRTEAIQTTISHPRGGAVSWGPGVTFGSGVSVMGVPIDPRTQLPVPNNIVETKRTIWVSFVFDNSGIPDLPNNISALPFMKECFQKIESLIKEIEEEIN
jgi:hypothetical protein